MGRFRGATVLMLGVAAVAGCNQHPSSVTAAPSLSVTPASALVDAPVSISLTGLAPAHTVTVTARATDATGEVWVSTAQFPVPASGTVSASQPSTGGSYRGSNAMGLFEFMAPPAGATHDDIFRGPVGGYKVALTASVSGRVVASATTYRATGASVTPKPLDLRPTAGGLYGEMHPATGSGARPAVLLFGGSEGGLDGEPEADLLAAHGYPTLDLAYFDEPGLPKSLAKLPLEYFAKALAFLRSQPGVDPHQVAVKGVSRGGELALILGATYPGLVNAVVAAVPSSQVNPGFPDASQPAWTLHGTPVQPGAIPVERIHGPILLACGGQDAVWNSCAYVGDITTRLRQKHFAYPVTPLEYPQAGHGVGIMFAYNSLTPAALAGFGGTLPANQAALADAHNKLLAFLATLG